MRRVKFNEDSISIKPLIRTPGDDTNNLMINQKALMDNETFKEFTKACKLAAYRMQVLNGARPYTESEVNRILSDIKKPLQKSETSFDEYVNSHCKLQTFDIDKAKFRRREAMFELGADRIDKEFFFPNIDSFLSTMKESLEDLNDTISDPNDPDGFEILTFKPIGAMTDYSGYLGEKNIWYSKEDLSDIIERMTEEITTIEQLENELSFLYAEPFRLSNFFSIIVEMDRKIYRNKNSYKFNVTEEPNAYRKFIRYTLIV